MCPAPARRYQIDSHLLIAKRRPTWRVVLVDQALEIIGAEIAQDRVDMIIVAQRQQHVLSGGATLAPLGRDRDGPVQHLFSARGSRQPSQHEFVPETLAADDRRVDAPGGDAAPDQQVADRPAPREGEQQMHRLDPGPPENPGRVLGQQQQIRRVTAKQAHPVIIANRCVSRPPDPPRPGRS